MAVRKKNKGTPRGANLTAATLACIADLLQEHMAPGIIPLLDESENHKAAASVNIGFNCAESEPVVEVSIRYSSTVTDRRVQKLDNPDQGTFAPVIAAAEEQTKGRKKKLVACEGEQLGLGEGDPGAMEENQPPADGKKTKKVKKAKKEKPAEATGE